MSTKKEEHQPGTTDSYQRQNAIYISDVILKRDKTDTPSCKGSVQSIFLADGAASFTIPVAEVSVFISKKDLPITPNSSVSCFGRGE